MKIAIFIFATFAVVACQNMSDFQNPYPEQPQPENFDLVTALLTGILQSGPVQYKLRKIYNVIDLKVRFLKIASEFLRRENLLLMRRILDFISRLCTFLMEFLPEPVEEPKSNFLEGLLPALFPVVPLDDPENPVNRVGRGVSQNGNGLSQDGVGLSQDGGDLSQNGVGFSQDGVSLSQDGADKLLEKHKNEVVQVAKLIYNTP